MIGPGVFVSGGNHYVIVAVTIATNKCDVLVGCWLITCNPTGDVGDYKSIFFITVAVLGFLAVSTANVEAIVFSQGFFNRYIIKLFLGFRDITGGTRACLGIIGPPQRATHPGLGAFTTITRCDG